MNRLLVRRFVLGGGLLALGVVLHRVVFQGALGGPGTGLELVEQWRRQEALDRHKEAVQACDRGREHIVAEVIAGRMTLRQAAAQLGQLYRTLKSLPGDTVGAARLPEDEEVLCRDILGRVEVFLRGSPTAAATVRARLEGEYRQHFNRRPPRLWPQGPLPPARPPATVGAGGPIPGHV